METITLKNIWHKSEDDTAEAIGQHIINDMRLKPARQHRGCYHIGKQIATPKAIARGLFEIIQQHAKTNEHTRTTEPNQE